MMFRRITDKNIQLELRHQRTSDVLFDLTDDQNPDRNYLIFNNKTWMKSHWNMFTV